MSFNFRSAFRLGHSVKLSKDGEIKGIVTAVQFRDDGQQIEVTYIHAGILYSPWVSETYLKALNDD